MSLEDSFKIVLKLFTQKEFLITLGACFLAFLILRAIAIPNVPKPKKIRVKRAKTQAAVKPIQDVDGISEEENKAEEKRPRKAVLDDDIREED